MLNEIYVFCSMLKSVFGHFVVWQILINATLKIIAISSRTVHITALLLLAHAKRVMSEMELFAQVREFFDSFIVRVMSIVFLYLVC